MYKTGRALLSGRGRGRFTTQRPTDKAYRSSHETQTQLRSAVGTALFRSLINNVNAPYVARKALDGEVTIIAKEHKSSSYLNSGVKAPSDEAPSFTPWQSVQFINTMGARAPHVTAGEGKKYQNAVRETETPSVGPSPDIPRAAMGRQAGLVGFLTSHAEEVKLLKRLRRQALQTQRSNRHADLLMELKTITLELRLLVEKELELEGRGRGRGRGGQPQISDPQRRQHVIQQSFQQLIGRLTPEHFAAGDAKTLLILLKVCSRSSSGIHTNFVMHSCAQILQLSASSLSHSDLVDVVIALASSQGVEDQATAGQLYLDWFLEYFIGAERMGPKVLGADEIANGNDANKKASKVRGSDESDLSTTSTRGEAPLFSLVPHYKLKWLVQLMLDREDAFVYGHCQAFLLKLLVALVSPMEPCADRYRSLSKEVKKDDIGNAQQELMKNLKAAQLRNSLILERSKVTAGYLSLICAAIIAYKVETVEALDFLIAAAPICLENAPVLRGGEISNILLAFVKVGYRDGEFLSILGEEAARRSEFLSDDDAGKVLTALELSGIEHDSLRAVFESSRRMRGLGRTNLAGFTDTAD